jgi:xylulokinase
MADFLLGIDYGTGGAKAAVIDDQGNDLGSAFEEYPFIHEKAGWSEHDAENYWGVACRIISESVRRAHVDPRQIKGIAVSSALPSLVMVDRHHNPVNRAYNLMDRRATAEVDWLKNEIGDERIFKTSAYRVEDHPNLVNLLWEKRHRPDDYARIWKALTIDGFVVLRLTGTASVHYSGAAFFGVAFNLRTREFDRRMMDEIGVDMSLMPDLYESAHIVGEVTKEAAEVTGLASGIPVAAGQVDCNASWIGAGATEPGDMQSNLGTVGNLGVIYRDIEFAFSDIGKLLMNFPYTTEDTYITVPTTLTGGQTVRYIRDAFSQAERIVEETSGVSSYDLLNHQAEKVPPGSDGLIALPYLMGERSPHWDANARGTIVGLSLNHTKGHLVRAFMEGVAYAMYHNYTLIQEAGLKTNLPLILNEGGAVSRLWRRIITDVFGIETAMVKRRTGAPFGDAVLAGVATGVFEDFTITKSWAEYVDPMEPDTKTHRLYLDYFELYKKLYEHLRDDYVELASLRART